MTKPHIKLVPASEVFKLTRAPGSTWVGSLWCGYVSRTSIHPFVVAHARDYVYDRLRKDKEREARRVEAAFLQRLGL